MFVRNVWLVQLVVFSVSFFVKEDVNVTDTNNHVAKEMIAKLIKESERMHVLFVYSNSEILDYFLRSPDLQIAVELNTLATMSANQTRKIGATILHLEDYGEFENFFNFIRQDYFLYDGHFMIFYDTADEKEMERIFSKFWKVHIYNVNVLSANPVNSDLVSVLTFMPFVNGSCGNTKAMRINEFNKTSMAWTTNVFFPKKFKQLNRCPLRFGCYENRPDIIVDRIENGSKRFSGINYDIVKMLSDALNSTLKVYEYEAKVGLIYKNKTATGMLKRAIDNEVDLIFASLQQDRSEAMSGTGTVYRDKVILVVPPPFLIDPMEKNFLPFTLASWISIGMVALLAYGIVKILSFTPKIVHDYVIGSNVRCSALNIWNVFLGGSLQQLPRSNLPRFLLAQFLIFTLIMRSLYQGAIFDIMKRDVNTIELNTFDEFIEHEFTFYVYQSLAGRIQGSKILRRFVKLSFEIRILQFHQMNIWDHP